MPVIKGQHIYLPKRTFDYTKWAVIACDQFTSDKEYWETVANYVSDAPTAYNLILPEIYLSNDNSQKIKEINQNIANYYNSELFNDEGLCMILVNRSTEQHKKRLGIVMTVDLENYSFNPDEQALIKATEHTILNRIPPRVEIRKNAIMEFSHVILLYDDRKLKIAENLYKNKENLEEVYNFNLNMQGGKLAGYKIKDKEVQKVINQFEELLKPEYLKETFNTDKPLLFAVGDGNHSLATAKEHWNNIKANLSEEEKQVHPARYALVEAINIHDEGIEFHPIHRVVFNAGKKFIKGLKKLFKVNVKKLDQNSYIVQKIITNGVEEDLYLPNNSPLAIKMVQEYIDNFHGKRLEMSVDYIHGEEELKNLCENKKDAVGITLPTLNKNELFEFIIKHGVLPRKAFSIGSAREKRYYLEGHKIKSV